MDILVEPLRATLQTKVKANSVKQEFEKQDELKRSALRAVAALLSIPDSGKCSHNDICIVLKRTRIASKQALHLREARKPLAASPLARLFSRGFLRSPK